MKLPKYVQAQSAEYISAYTEYVKLAKRANTRLLRLERLATQPHYKSVKNYAYRKAMKHIRDTGSTGARFSTRAPSTMNELRTQLSAVKNFLESPTSTKTQITRSYKKMADSINQKYDENFTWDELARFYESEAAAVASDKFGSDTMMRALGAVKRFDDEPEAIREAIKGNIVVDEDDIVNEVAKALLKLGVKAVFK